MKEILDMRSYIFSDLDERIDITALIPIFRRQWLVVAEMTILFLLVGILYLVTAVPKFTASAVVEVDRANIARNLMGMLPQKPDEHYILSQIAVLRSDTILQEVVDKYRLAHNPEFWRPAGSFSRLIASFMHRTLGSSSHASAAGSGDARDLALKALREGMNVSRVGKSNILVVNFTSPLPDLAAIVATGLTTAYILDNQQHRFNLTADGQAWVADRLSMQRTAVKNSDMAVQQFIGSNQNLLMTKTGPIGDQELSDLSWSFIKTKLQLASAQARLSNIERVIGAGQTNSGTVADALSDLTYQGLQQKFADVSKREAEISETYGPNHIQAQKLRTEMQGYKSQMIDELGRIAATYRSDLEAAHLNEMLMANNLNKAVERAEANASVRLRLEELQRVADSDQNVYEQLLARSQMASQQLYPIADVRLISVARTPKKASSPKTTNILGLCAGFGLALGVGIAGLRESRDRFLRTGDQLITCLGMRYLGSLPILDLSASERWLFWRRHSSAQEGPGGLAEYISEYPNSAFVQTLRNILVEVDRRFGAEGARVVAVGSLLPREGKSTVAKALAEINRMRDKRVLLVHQLYSPQDQALVVKMSVFGNAEPRSHIEAPKISQNSDGIAQSSELIEGHDLTTLRLPAFLTAEKMNTLRYQFDCIIIEIPVLRSNEHRTIIPLIDCSILVVEWGKISSDFAAGFLSRNADFVEKCVGAVINKVDRRKNAAYETEHEYVQSSGGYGAYS